MSCAPEYAGSGGIAPSLDISHHLRKTQVPGNQPTTDAPGPDRLTRMRIGAHVDDVDPLAEAAEREADLVQFFLADPQGWKAPAKREDAAAITESDVDVFIHAPYVINLASLNNRIRVPSRRLLLQHAKAAATVGAKGLIVHGGHVRDDEDIATGFDNWRKAFAY